MALHIGLICNSYPPFPHGGIGSSNQDLAEGLVKAGHQVTVVGLYPKHTKVFNQEKVAASGVKIVALTRSPEWLRYRPRILMDRWRVRRWLRASHARKPFHILEFSDYAGWLPWGGPKGVPAISRLQGTNMLFDKELKRSGSQFEYQLERNSLIKANYWIGLSNYVYSETLDVCDLEEKPGAIIPHAVDVDFFAPSTKPECEKGLIVFVNQVIPRKGVAELVESANWVCHQIPEARYVFIGQNTLRHSDTSLYSEHCLEKVEPKYRSRIQFIGRLPRQEILPWLRRAEVCCYPSHAETFGIAPVEAMSVGRPTVYSTCGPGPEVIEDGVSGLLCDPHDPRDIAEKIIAIMRNPCMAKTFGANARTRVLQKFNKATWLERNISVFEKWADAGKPSID